MLSSFYVPMLKKVAVYPTVYLQYAFSSICFYLHNLSRFFLYTYFKMYRMYCFHPCIFFLDYATVFCLCDNKACIQEQVFDLTDSHLLPSFCWHWTMVASICLGDALVLGCSNRMNEVLWLPAASSF